ncbi:MAG: tRNA lysidine(34) synthetase, partial [Bacillota bacterium]
LVAEKVAGELGGPGRVKIAVGHNANDQAETVLFRILRGTGMDGLAGMAYMREERRGEGEDGTAYRVIRPLLDVWREDVEEYCAAKGLEPVTDNTNNEELYARNRIRLDLIPYIEEKYNTNFQEGLVRMAKIAAADKDYFWEETSRTYENLKVTAPDAGEAIALDWRGLADCHEALRHRVILKAFGEIGLSQDITAERLEAADRIILGNVGGKTVEFPHGYSLSAGKGFVILRNDPE